jgi:hypothetical protein
VSVLLAAFLIPLGAHAAAGAAGGARPASARIYVVRSGDTLWSIGQRLAGPGADPRPYVDEVVSLNHLGSYIVPGERLRLP